MKKILFASTALVLSAGIAAAEVTIGGDGRMGVVYDDANAREFEFNSRIRISFTATGETDGGLQFGGSIRADNAPPAGINATITDANGLSPGDVGFNPATVQVNNANSGGGVNGLAGSVFVSGAFGKLTMGDIDSAGKKAVGQVGGVGYTGIGDLNEIAYINGGDDEGALYEYSFGAASFYASIGQVANSIDEYGIGMKYDAGTFYVAIGYDVKDGDAGRPGVAARPAVVVGGTTILGAAPAVAAVPSTDGSQLVIGAGASVGGFDFKAVYGMIDYDAAGRPDNDQYALSVGGNFAGAGVTAFYADSDLTDARYGIGGTYDLGGGAELAGGIAHDSTGTGRTRADFGIKMSF